MNIKENFNKIRIAGTLAANTLDEVTTHIKPGITTDKIDKICYEFIRDHGGYSAPLYYRGFPKSCCTSANHIICHGIPGNKELREGDIVNVDVTAIVDGWHGDTSRMFTIGEVSVKAKNLIMETFNSMMKGISIIKEGISTGDIGFEIQNYIESKGYSVVRDFCGYGIGTKFHEQPNILHYGKKNTGTEIKQGMIFTVEPMINFGKYDTKVLDDGWTAVTKDKTLSAQFEHTVGVTHTGYEIFTESKRKLDKPPYKI